MKEPQSVSWARTRKVRKDVTLTQAVKALRHHEVRNHLALCMKPLVNFFPSKTTVVGNSLARFFVDGGF